jgi:eukaryotic-like serine/threonine-protein kinase
MGDGDATALDPLLSRARARVGVVLREKYRLDRVLGVGGMAAVYAATHLRNAHRVAVKILHPDVAANPDLRARFLREGYAANSVNHPGTVRVLDDDTAEDGAPFLVMELLDGETLDARWERSGRKLGAREVAALVSDLLDVLAAAHTKGVVHRDIKPENLFLTREGRLKVLDFGVARLREASATQTRAGVLFGTPAFMAPEQALGRTRDVDALSDLWAVGATAFSLLTGQFVHPSETVEEMLVRTATQPVLPLASVLPQVPLGIAQVVDRALAFEKRDRWQSARAMQEALAQACEHAWAPPDSDHWEDDGRTRVAPPPKTTRGETQPPLSAPRYSSPALPEPDASTVAGVSSYAQTWHVPRGRKLIAAGTAGVVLIVVASIAIAVVTGPRHTQLAAPASSPGVPVAVVMPTNAAPVVLPTAAATAVMPSAASAPAPRVVPPPPSPRGSSGVAIRAAAIATLPRPPAAATPTSTPEAPPPQPPPPPSPASANCNPPYTRDPTTGSKRWKAECL